MKPFQQIFSKKKTKLQGKKKIARLSHFLENLTWLRYDYCIDLSKILGQVFECPEMDETFFFDLKATPHVFKGENKNDFMVIIDHHPLNLNPFFRRSNSIQM